MADNNTKIPEEFKTFLEWQSITMDAMADLGDKAKAFVKPATGSLGVMIDYIDSKSWDQIVGKALGTVIDEWIIGKIGGAINLTAKVGKLKSGIAEGYAVVTVGKTDYSAANYFEKAFPVAKIFYEEMYYDIVNGDGSYARSIWEGVKGLANTDQTMTYYKDITFEQYMNDMKDLFTPVYQIPSGGVGVSIKNKKAVVIAPENSDEEKTIVNDVLSNRKHIEQIQINNTTFNITQTNPLTVRNALDDIPEVSLLLTHILIKTGEKIDLGDKGIYTVQSGDTLSQIAEANGYVTKDLLKLNTWLIDEGRVTFDQNKVLIETDANDLANQDHVLTGDSFSANILKDFNGGNDVLVGGSQADVMEGGSGFDTYVANDGDTIKDSDNKGKVHFNNIDLTGSKSLLEGMDDMYEDDDFVYQEDGSSLIVTHKQGAGSITIKDWSDGGLGIKLGENKDIEISVTEKLTASEGDSGTQSLSFTVSLSRELEDGESLEVSVSSTKEGSYTFRSGEKTKTFTHTWYGDTYDEKSIDHRATFTPSVVKYIGMEDIKVSVKNSGKATIYDDDDDNRYDPLVLDTNKDGFISTSSLDESQTYFDITGDGLRERIGWVKAEDALIAYDKDDNGQIDGIDEVFGNLSESGFEEIKRLIDSNHDNKIDRKDELFYRLETWNDLNQDGKVQEGELKSLHDAGVESIDLNYVSTNIELNGNLLTEASKYTDSDGNKELAADIQLAADVKDTHVDIGDIPNFTIDETTRELPQFKGSGLVYDAFIKYNIDEEFKAVAKELTTDMKKMATEFDAFIEHYSGYTEYVNELSQRYSLKNFQMHEADKEAWIVDRFNATDRYTSQIEKYYEDSLDKGYTPQSAKVNSSTINIKYDLIAKKLESSFALQSIFKDVVSDTHYDIESATFIVDDQTALQTKVAQYFNNDNHTIEEKLYLAKVMQMQGSGLSFEIDSILKDIDSDVTKELVRDIYIGSSVSLYESKDADIMLGSNEDDILNTNSQSKILLNGGDDILHSGEESNVFFFRKGDGKDTIQDDGGYDRLVFDEGINRDDVVIQLNRNKDLIIAIKEEGKRFDELSDKVIMVDWIKPEHRVERIEFGNGSTLKLQDVFEQFEATDGVENIRLSGGNDTLDTKGGDDVIKAGAGNDILIGGKGDDRLEGGSGNDIYIFNRGDGKDKIIDSDGHDTLQFAAGITEDDLMAKFVGSNLLIAVKEEGKTFEELSDVVTMQNYKSSQNTIEAIFLDGYNPVSVQKLLNAPTEGDDTITLGNANYNVDLLAGNDVLNTSSGSDIIHGGSGNDTIKSFAGNDTLEGNEGDDRLEGGLGNDTYVFSRGDGKDTIYDDASFGYGNSQKRDGGEDTLQFGEGIVSDDIVTKYSGTDLLIGIKDGDKAFEELSDVVVIENYTDDNNKIENILFYDGSIVEISLPREGTQGSDKINLKNETEDLSILALSGRDFVHTGSGDDYIQGDGGSDDLHAGSGNDILVGGKQDDFLVGGSGNDTYIFNRGDGADAILDDNRPGYYYKPGVNFSYMYPRLISQLRFSGVSQVDAGNDTLKFGEGISKEDISFRESGNDLIVTISDGGGSITIKEYFNTKNSIENFVLSDGTTIEAPKITTGNDTYIFNRGEGKDTISDSAGNDTIKFSEGITQSDLIGRLVGDDFIIAIKEDGKSFESLSDKITIKNYTNSNNKIENIEFADGSRILTDSLIVATEQDDNIILQSGDIDIDLLAGNDSITTGSGDDNIKGGSGDDNIITNAGSDTIDGGSGDDTIISGLGNDTLVGGKGIDTLQGGRGDDTYIFNRGDGKDTIYDNTQGYKNYTEYGWYRTTNAGNDTIKFSEGITQSDLIGRLVGDDFIIAIKEDGKSFESLSDKITIKNYTNSNNKIENIEFADGSRILTDSLIVATEQDDNIILQSGDIDIDLLAGNDSITTGSGDDNIKGGSGDDNIITNAGSDTIDGGSGDDTIISGLGNDTLVGGKGIDTLQGGRGDDTYIFNRGDGKDTIYDNTQGYKNYTEYGSYWTTNAGNDTIKFSEGITQSDLIGRLVGDDFIIAIKEDGKSFESLSDKITIKNYTNSNNKIENIEFADGSRILTDSLIVATEQDDNFIFQSGDIDIDLLAGNDSITTGRGDDNIKGGSGDDNIITNAGSDTIDGGSGDDTIISGLGNDTLVGGKGIDTLQGGGGDDTYIFNRGDGKDTIYDNTQGYNNYTEYGSYWTTNAGNDTIKFSEGITQSDLIGRLVGDDFIIAIKEDGKSFESLSDKITIKNYTNSNNKIENIEFADGSRILTDSLIVATEQDDNFIFQSGDIDIDLLAGNDSITTGRGDDNIKGGSGDDNIITNAGSDTIDGGSGDDTIISGLGNDTLVGGKGIDTLQGGGGDDTYIFNRGDGKDTIYDNTQGYNNYTEYGSYWTTNAGNDTIKFGEGITKSDLLFKQDDFNLIIALKEDGKSFESLSDKITITDWFKKDNNIESIVLEDGSSISTSWIAAEVLGASIDTLYSKYGAVMSGGFGDDIYVYKKDDFTVVVDDKFSNKEIEINAGDDTLKFEDINRDKVTIGTKGKDLILKIDAEYDGYTELKDYVVIRDWQDANRGIEQIVFGDGEVLTIDKSATYDALEFDENWITSRYYIYGSENNSIKGTEFSEVIESGAGDDSVVALGGNDYITGGLGNDTLDGGEGDDTYVFNLGDGIDTIIDAKGVDTITFGSSITQADLITKQIDNDLVIAVKEDGKTVEELSDKVILTNWFDEETIDNRVELMVTEDGGTVAIADFIIRPTENADDLEYGDENNHIDALDGDDIIHIGGGDDVLSGNAGDDTLYGEDGNDTISGDSGDDTLVGAEGDDIYLFGRGDGNDTIVEDDFTDWSRTGSDTLRFKEGIGVDDVILIEDGDNLIVALKEDGKTFESLSDKITLKKWATYDEANSRDYSRDYFAIENFSFSDGSSWNMSDIIAHIGTDSSDTLHGFNSDDTLNGQKGDDTLQGYLGDDTYVFKRGDGKDTIYDFGRKGDDYSYYDAGNDTLKFGVGIGADDFLITKEEESDDITVTLLEDGKSFEELSDKIIIKDWFKANNRVENILLHDGTTIDIVNYLNAEPTEGNDKLLYGNGNDIVDALAGNDIVIAQGGDDIIDGNRGDDDLQGGLGNDILIGGADDDKLDGGTGDDRLEGGEGDDTYIFNLGDGHDTISDYTQTEGEIDKLVFGTDIISENLEFIRRENDLTIMIDENNSIKVENWFLEDSYKIEELKFIDESVLAINDVENRVKYYGDEDANIMVGSDNSSQIFGLEGDDTITGSKGADTIYGGKGDDTYIFNLGDGHDTIDDFTSNTQETNKIIFGEGIEYSSIQQVTDGDDMIFTINEENSLKIKNWNTQKNITKMEFADSSIVTFGTEESNTIISSRGIDYMFGDAGDDVYLFGRGWGRNDTIVDTSGIETIKFAEGIAINDIFVKREGDNFFIALDEDGKNFETFSDVIKVSQNDIEKIAFFDGTTLDISSIVLEKNIEDTILEKDQIDTIYTGSLNEDTINHNFTILPDTVSTDKESIKDLSITVTDAQKGLYKVDGNFDALQKDEVAHVSFDYEVHYDSKDQNLISGIKKVILAVIGTNDIPEVTGVFSGEATEDSATIATGKVDITDKDHDENAFQAQSNTQGEYGLFTIDTEGNWQYEMTSLSIKEGETATDTFSVVSKDGTVTKDVVLTLHGASNDKPIITQIVLDTQVNTYTNDNQYSPIITALNDGGYVVSWTSDGQDGLSGGVYLQRYSAAGERVGKETQVNSYADGSQSDPTITTLNDGGYVVSWTSSGQDSSGNGVYLQRYNASGEKVGNERQVNTYTNDNQYDPTITALNDGGYIISWVSYHQDGIGNGLYMQRYDSDDKKIGEIVHISSDTYRTQSKPSITSLNDGGYILSWEDSQYGDLPEVIYLQRYNKDGQKLNEEIRIGAEGSDTKTMNAWNTKPSITSLNDGGYVVCWSFTSPYYSDGIYLQRFNASGDRVEEEIRVSNYTSQYNPTITALNDGGYVVSWTSNGQDGSGYGVYLQKYNASGEKVGEERQVNSYTDGSQSGPTITSLNDGGYVVSWQSDGQDGSDYGIYLQKYNADGEKVGELHEPITEFSLKSTEDLQGNLNYIKDPSSKIISYSATAQHGEFAIDADGKWHYTPYNAYNGKDEVVVNIENENSGVLNHTLIFNVQSTNFTLERGIGKHELPMDTYDFITLSSKLSQGDIIIKKENGMFLMALKEDGKSFDELSDVLTLNSSYIDKFVSADGSVIVTNDMTFEKNLNTTTSSFEEDINISGDGTKNIVLNGEITSEGDGNVSIDYWHFTHAGGNISIDLQSEKDGDIDGDGIVNSFDSYIYLYKDNISSSTKIDSNDDSEGTDSALTLSNLDSGNYILVVSSFSLDENEIKTGINNASSYGPYKIDITTDNPTTLIGKKIGLGNNITIKEGNGLETIYIGNLLADYSEVAHTFVIDKSSISTNIDGISDLTISLVDATTGEYKVDGNFDALAKNEELIINFDYSVNYTDNSIVSSIKKASLTITGTDDNIVVTGDLSGEVTEDSITIVSGVLNVNDVDHNEGNIQPLTNIECLYGTFNINNEGSWSYELKSSVIGDGESKVETFKVNDTTGKYISDIAITINGVGESYELELQPQIYEQQVNTYTNDDQDSPTITALNDGGYVVSWESSDQDGSGNGIYMQRYSADGEKVGAEIQVNTFTEGYQDEPVIAALKNGGYVVTWGSRETWNADEKIFVQNFDNNGAKVGDAIEIDSIDTRFGSNITITSLSDSGYVVTWEALPILPDGSRDNNNNNIYLQQFDDGGNKVGEIVEVNTYTSDNQMHAKVVVLEDNKYAVVWDSGSTDYYGTSGQDGSSSGTYMQLFDANANKIGNEIQVNSYTNSSQQNPKTATLNDGSYLVCWESSDQDGDSIGIYLQRFDTNGNEIGNEIQVNSYTKGSQRNPEISVLNNGNYIVTWQSGDWSNNQDGDKTGVYLQQFTIDGEKVGAEIQVNSTTSGYQEKPQIVSLSDGNYIVAWESNSDINIQKFDTNGNKIEDETKVNTYLNSQLKELISLDNGGYIVLWSADGQDGSESGIFLQQFNDLGEKVGISQAINPYTNYDMYNYGTYSGNLDYIKTVNNNTLSYRVDKSSIHGDFNIDVDGKWTYNSQGYRGIEEINILLDDGNGGSLIHTLTFNVIYQPSPIVIDLDGDGKTSISLQDSTAYFDYNADGTKVHTAWVDKGDAQLVVDINQDGKINDGSEIFGEYTKLPDGTLAKDGYEALAQYDTNKDRVIDSKDEAFGDLLLWKDANQNGKSEEGELLNIQLSGITAINLDREDGVTFERVMENGNTILNETNYKGINGDGIIRDIGFAYDARDTITNNDTLDATFVGVLSGEDGNDTYLYKKGDGFMTIDDKGDGIDSIKFADGITKEQLVVKWDKKNNGLIIGIKDSADDLTALVDINDKIFLQNWFTDSGLIENIEFSDGSMIDKDAIYNLLLSTKETQGITTRVLDENGELVGGNYRDVLYGSTGEEKLQGLAGNDFLKGLDGDDLLLAGEGDDSLEGGKGDDSNYGEGGDDYYIYNRGDGRDLIVELSGYDILMFGEGISQEDIIIQEDGYDVLIGLNEGDKELSELSDVIRIQNQLIPSLEVEKIEFYDGSTLMLPSNNKPIIEDLNLTLQEDQPLSGIFNVAGSMDGLTYKVTTPSQNATLSIDEQGNYTYTPKANYNGSDSIIIEVTNRYGQSDTATLTFDIEAVNDVPIAREDSANVIENSTLVINASDILANDTDVDDGDMLTITTVTTPQNKGVATVDENGNVTFVAGGDFEHLANGETEVVELSYTIRDSSGETSTSTIKVNVTGANDVPIAMADNVTLDEDTTIRIDVLANDSDVDDGDTIGIKEVTTNPTHGVVTINSDNTISYKPTENYFGEDSFEYEIVDAQGEVSSSKVTLNVNGINDAPTLAKVEEDIILTQSTKTSGEILASDVENDTLIYSISTSPAHGLLSVDETGSWRYNIDSIYTGKDSAKITVDDGNGGVVEKILNFTIDNHPINGDEQRDRLKGTNEKDIINGLGGNDRLYGYRGDDELFGGDGNDSIYASYGDDEITAGKGNDYVDGGKGDDTYYFNLGDGADKIKDYDRTEDNHDTISLGEGISKEDLNFYRDRKDLIIDINDHDSITIKSWYTSRDRFKIEELKFSDGSSLTQEEIEEITIIEGDERNNRLKGSNDNDKIYGLDGNDKLYGYNGDDKLYGGSGNDLIYADDGNDTITGGKGRDYLNGGKGDDTYYFNLGDGADKIKDFDTTKDNYDVIVLGKDINRDNLHFYRERNDLIIDINEQDSITIQKWYESYDRFKLEELRFSDGSSLTQEEIEEVTIIEGDERNNRLKGSNENDKIYGLEGDDKLYGYNGDDKLYGGDGKDTIYGDNGKDLIIGGKGDDNLYGDKGDDSYIFNLGDGNDWIEDFDTNKNNHDKIVFGEDINREQLDFKRDGQDMVITVNDNDSITVNNWYESYDRFKIEELSFRDGTSMSLEEMENSSPIKGDERNNRLKGSNISDVIFGLDGKDKLYGYKGNDTLYGGDGNDLIYGDKGNDIIIGGKGNDYLSGGKGNDRYHFSLGDGVDKIKDYDNSNNSHDKIVFGEGIEKDDVVFMMDKNNLIINYGEGDSINILRYSKSKSKIEEVALADGSYMSSEDIDKMIQSINAYASEKGIEVDSINDIKKSQEMMNIVSNGWHH